jgi:uncharacterized phage protein (TIGR02220 family)
MQSLKDGNQMSNADKILIPNSFQTPNALIDEVMPNVGGPAFKVLLAITRLTLGWNHLGSVEISLDNLQKRTGLSRQGVIDALRELKKLDLVIIAKGPRNSRIPNHYALNLNLTTGKLVHNLDQSKLLTNATSQQIRPKLVNNSDSLKPRKPNKKERTESDKLIPDSSFPIPKEKRNTARRRVGIPPELQPTVSRIVTKINELAGTHYRDDKPDALRNLLARLDEGRTEAECLAVVEGRHAAWADNDKMLEYFRPSTLFAGTHFEDYLQAAQRNSNGHPKPPEVKDLGDGWLEVDGMKISQKDYDRRWKQA